MIHFGNFCCAKLAWILAMGRRRHDFPTFETAHHYVCLPVPGCKPNHGPYFEITIKNHYNNLTIIDDSQRWLCQFSLEIWI